MHGPESSQRLGAPTRERAKQIAEARAAFDRDSAALGAAVTHVERLLRDVRITAQQIGALEELQSGRAAPSTRDSLLAAIRQAVTEAAHRLEQDAWSSNWCASW